EMCIRDRSGIWYKTYIDNSCYAIEVDKPKISVSNVNPSYEKNIYVEISGNVLKSGVYSINNAGNLGELIYKAGGLTEGVTLKNMDSSTPIFNGQHFIIDSNGNVTITYSNTIIKREIPNDESDAVDIVLNMGININTASKEELMALPKIGDVMSDRIIDYREKNGGFKTIEEIKNVSGIGDKTFENIKDFITVE
ncbi:MAG: helix-hairpin-helix domain-containing protein, partial [Tyzzerella sp.]|nr:helix-hairpin-helix domain-containing protein [Candidatus Fimicola merdigallinarum]